MKSTYKWHHDSGSAKWTLYLYPAPDNHPMLAPGVRKAAITLTAADDGSQVRYHCGIPFGGGIYKVVAQEYVSEDDTGGSGALTAAKAAVIEWMKAHKRIPQDAEEVVETQRN